MPSNPMPNTEGDKKSNILTVALIVVALFAAFATYGWMSNRSQATELQSSLTETEAFKVQAEQQYYEALAELEQMRGDNEELNAMIDEQKAELKTAKEKIDGLTRDSRNLSAARRELSALRTQVDGYLAELNQLREENQMLADANNQLTSEKNLLSSDLESVRQSNEALSQDRAVLVSQTEQLAAEKEKLSRKVTAGAVIGVSNLSAVGQKQRSSGKYVDRNDAKNVERIYVCFNTDENRVATAGEEVYFLRIISPIGETINIAAEGGGALRSEESGEMIPYTKPVYFQFDGTAGRLCTEWNVASQNYSAGTYNIELYNKGYLAGKTTMVLK